MERTLEGGSALAGEKLGVGGVLFAPARVYRTLRQRGTLHRLLWGFFGASLLHGFMVGMTAPEGSRTFACTLAVFNALGMALLWTLIGWGALGLAKRGPVSLAAVAPGVAYGFGVTLLVSWIPGSFWFAEPWKWGVIGTGFRELGGVTGRVAFGAVVGTLVTLICLFKAILMMQGA